MGRFFSELRRRRVFRTAALYVVGAWLALQVADVLFPALEIPEQSIRYLLYAAVLGFPVALVFGWFFDISADGIHRTGPASESELRTRHPLARKDYLLLGALACVLGAILYGTLTNVKVEPAQVAATPPQRSEGPPMVAVLPFANMSADDNGAFFARGVHDDLLTQLAQITSLRVISRTSVLEYEGTTKSIPQIGRELGADVVLEGGIQLAGEEMRINAQLIDARTDEHLWAETFDRDLSAGSIFKVQSEIARAIANALQATLSTAEAAGLDVIPTENLAAYRAYHEAMRFAEENHLDRTTNRPIYRAGLQKAIDLDPTFTWPILELLGNIALGNFQEQNPDEIAQVEGMIEDIRRLKPDSFELLTAQGYYAYYILKDYDLALQLIGQARARNPSNARLLDIQGWIQRRNNDLEGALESSRLALQLEPGNGRRIQFILNRLQMMHRYAEALAFAEAQPRLNGSAQAVRSMLRVQEHHDLVRHRDELLEIMETGEGLRFYDYFWLWQAHMSLGEYESAASVVSNMDDPYRFQGEPLERLSLSQALSLIQAITMQDEAAMARQAEQARVSLGLLAADGTALEPSPGPDKESQALIRIAEGDFAPAIELLQQGYREAARADPIAFIQARSNFCQGYGMAGAPELAVACIREGLVEPSTIAPFFEPLLPYYDRIRDSAAFQELVAELQAEGWLKAQE
jgi:TolB-like protein